MTILKSSDDSNATTTDQYISTILHILFFSVHSLRFSIFQFPFCCRSLSVEQRFEIIRSIGEECIQDDELRNLLANKPDIVCYDGFEPSGRMHIAQGVLKAINVNKLTSAGCRVKIWVADWFAKLNNKMGGDLKKIETVGQYFIEIWKASGMDLEGGKVEFLWSSKEINAGADKYWPLVLDIAQKFRLKRIIRCSQIMGRNEHENLTASQIMYPCMQCADIFFLKADICQLGMDQRKVNVLAREYCDLIKRKNKPIILSHHMLPGLKQGQEKMSKSNKSSSIFMEDDKVDVIEKIANAHCPPKIVEGNSCLEYIRHLIFPSFKELTVERGADNGGNKMYTSFEELVVDYESGELHLDNLKSALSKSLNEILESVREHFKKDEYAKGKLEEVKRYQATMEPIAVEEAAAAEALQTLSMDEPSNSNAATQQLLQRFKIVRSVGAECTQENELLNILASKSEPVCYDGFEPSGRMTIDEGIMKTIHVNKLVSAGCRVKIVIADCFAKLNNKMGGNLKKIETIGRYMVEIWKSIGMDLKGGKVEFLWSSKEINARADEYWPLVLDIAQKFSVDICQMGMDQRKVNVLARDYCDITKRNKPVILSHNMLPGPQQGQDKMLKTDPSTCIFMDDTVGEVKKKINSFYCSPKIVEGNPCFDYIKRIVLPWFNVFIVERSDDNGGNKTFTSFEEVVADYETGELHPKDLKLALSASLNKILEPIREHFKNDKDAKELQEQFKKACKISK
ncbi:Nucleotidylyl transferase superfamily protein [Trifolium repens]|nr:Nucleotidylyl transferase superfamily protein [Trifolium repens]